MKPPDRGPQCRWEVLTVEDEAAGRRLDQWLAEKLAPRFSRSRLKAMIEDGEVRVGSRESQPGRRLAAGERVEWRGGELRDADPAPEPIPLDILYEDEALIVVNKPAGLVVHPGAGNAAGTLVNALIAHCGASLSGIGGVRRPGIVHRLDKDTSGVMVAAKNDAAHRALAAAFADHGRSGGLERKYLALVWGCPDRRAGTIDAPLGRSTSDRTKRAVVPAGRTDGRAAVTRYIVREAFGARNGAIAALIECRLETGRTHQIRVHMSYMGHPVIGDQLYGRGFASKARMLSEGTRMLVERFPRQALHAATLGFIHPGTGVRMRFEAPIPTDMAALIESLSKI